MLLQITQSPQRPGAFIRGNTRLVHTQRSRRGRSRFESWGGQCFCYLDVEESGVVSVVMSWKANELAGNSTPHCSLIVSLPALSLCPHKTSTHSRPRASQKLMTRDAHRTVANSKRSHISSAPSPFPTSMFSPLTPADPRSVRFSSMHYFLS